MSPLVEYSGGSFVTGRSKAGGRSQLESNNVNEGDYLILTSNNDINGVTNILRLNQVQFDQKEVFIDDLAGGSKTVSLNDAGYGVLITAGAQFGIYADPSGAAQIAVDQTGDGVFDGTRAKIVVSGGAMLETSSSSLVLRVPQKLFHERTVSSDETVTMTFVDNSGDLMSVYHQARHSPLNVKQTGSREESHRLE